MQGRHAKPRAAGGDGDARRWRHAGGRPLRIADPQLQEPDEMKRCSKEMEEAATLPRLPRRRKVRTPFPLSCALLSPVN